ncbi:MAG: fatty acyl-AMP ligase [Lysobacter sp.]|nr:fatty acyl-AMP ligase [Lysobacter sp.]
MRLDTANTILDCIDHYAATQPTARAASFLVDGDAQEETLDYGELRRRARALAATLRREGAADAPVLLLFHSGIEFLIGFFACLYAGTSAVPANVARNRHQYERLRLILEDAHSVAVLTTDELRATVLAGLNAEASGLRVLTEHAVAEADADAGAETEATRVGGDDVAFLQYTSGSTGHPKGVMVTHAQLLANVRAIRDSGPMAEHFCCGGWLPQFHDMGLIGMSLAPLALGGQVAFISPLHFLQRPLRWLRLIQRYRISISPEPNFALEMCARIPREQIPPDLDLSSLDGLYCGAEPVNAQTVARFVEAFAPFGLSADAVKPCYGLAEATLIVSGGATAPEHRVVHVERKALAQGRALPIAADSDDAQAVVCCGSVVAGHRLIVVDPDTGARRADGEVGELWFSGPSVASGYWRNPEASAATFGARSPDCEGAFMRTGDLGFMLGDRVHVTGRIKELIILRGRNYYPTDLEATIVEAALEQEPRAAGAFAAAFAFDESSASGVAALLELPRGMPLSAIDRSAIVERVRTAMTQAHDLTLKALIVVEQGGIPRTSSGKLQRRKCAKMYLKGEFAESKAVESTPTESRPAKSAPAETASIETAVTP